MVERVYELLEQHRQSVYRYALKLTGNEGDAEDLSQQTFLIAQQKIQQLREASKARPWLFAIQRSIFLKRLQKKQEVLIPMGDESTWEFAVTPVNPDIERLNFMDVLSGLSDEHRVILIMYYFEQYSYKEIARELDVKIGTVMSRLSRAKLALKEKLGTEEQSAG